MATTNISRNDRPKPLRQSDILTEMRDEIVSGRLAPGMRLPTRRQLLKKYRSSLMTIHHVCNSLIRDGFAEPRGKLGTFVSANPPHLCDYGLVFYSRQGTKDWRRFDAAMLNEASTSDWTHARKMHFYYDIMGHSDAQAEQSRLLSDVSAHKLAGLIFTTNPPISVMEALSQQSLHVPVTAILGQADIPNLTAVMLNRESLIAKALDYLAGRGRRRVAFLNKFQSSNLARLEERQRQLEEQQRASEKRQRASAAQRGMTCEPHWTLSVDTSGVGNVVHLLFESGRPNRPDALIITDDNLVEYATAGLVTAGVRVPDDVDVVAHCNFPWPVPSAVPVKRIGYDTREVLRQCVSVIDMQRQGQTPPEQVFVEAVFEEEMAAVVSAQLVAS